MPKGYRHTHSVASLFSYLTTAKKFNHTLLTWTALQSICQHTTLNLVSVIWLCFHERSTILVPNKNPPWRPHSRLTLPTSSLVPSLAAFCHLHMCRCMLRSLCLKWRSLVLPFMQRKSSAGYPVGTRVLLSNWEHCINSTYFKCFVEFKKEKDYVLQPCGVTVQILFTTMEPTVFMPESCILPLEPVVLRHSSFSDRALPGWKGCWPGHFGRGPWFLGGKHPPEDGQDGVPDPLKKVEWNPGRHFSSNGVTWKQNLIQ